MLKGLYTAYTGMLNEQNRMDVLTNNLANTSTKGYKKEGATAQSFADIYAYKVKDKSEHISTKRLGEMSFGVKIGENYTDFSAGSLQVTNNEFDLALEGEGFFAIQFTNKAGETSTKYTRDGSFTVNNEGNLVTEDGDFVLGTDGNPITLALSQPVSINTDGTVYQNDEQVGQLQIIDFENYDFLEKYGENLMQTVEGAQEQPAAAQVRQGALEASNVQPVNEMVNMIAIQRAYDTNQKVITTMDDILDKTVNQVGRV